MNDTELYQQILGLQRPWRVCRVDAQLKGGRIEVFVDHPIETLFECSVCKKPLAVFDHTEERMWRHLDTCQYRTVLRARLPRVDCPEHGVKQIVVPWAEPRSRFTAMFEAFAISVLRETSVSGGAEILHLSWDEAWGLMERAVKRGRSRRSEEPVARIGVDEKAIAKGHRYLTIVCDLDHGHVQYIATDRTREALDGYYEGLGTANVAKVTAVAMDMWPAFIGSTRKHVPDADTKIVFDRFHIMKHVLDAVDNVRRKENAELARDGDKTLAKTRYLWLYNLDHLPSTDAERFEVLRKSELKTARAWAIKESLRRLWEQPSVEEAKEYWERWYSWASRCCLAPIVKAAETVRSHIDNVLTYYAHPITNASSEGINSAIQTIKVRAAGFRNPEHFKAAIFFHCGGLDMDPKTA